MKKKKIIGLKKTNYIKRVCLSAMMVFFSLLPSYAISAYQEEMRLSVNLQDMTLGDVFSYIENHSEYIFIYHGTKINTGLRVNVHVKDMPIDKLLDQITRGLDISYLINNRQIIIRKNESGSPHTSNPVSPVINQQKQVLIQGTVVDNTGIPLIGVNILEKGTSNGATTDINGKFELNVSIGVTLVASYIGYMNEEIKVTSQKALQIIMKDDLKKLDEVVVVGYGVQQKRDITGSIAAIKGDNLKNLPVAQLTNALQGLASGIDIVSDGGSPGSEPVIRVRGTGSMNASNPLVVIDGVPSGEISDVNPNDIETIEVLKDASSSAIYGTRAANGVIIITTKRGRKETKTNIELNAFAGIANISKQLDLLTAPNLAMLKKERYANDNIPVNTFWYDPYYSNQRTDWQKELFNQGTVYNVDMRLTGGNEKSNYMSSIGYYKEKGTIIDSDFERVSLRLNSDHQVTERLKIGQSVQYTYRKWYNPSTTSVYSGVVWQALRFNPAIPNRLEDGGWGSAVANNELGDINNPAYELSTENHERTNHGLLATVTLDLRLVDELFLKGNASFNGAIYNYKDFSPQVSEQMRKRNDAELLQGYENKYSFIGEAYLSYQKKLGKLHSLNTMAGFSAQKNNGEYFNASKKSFADESEDQVVLDNGSVMGSINGNYYTESALASFFGRAFYSYNNRYLLTATFRADGSSKFAPGEQWGYFPAFSLGWRLSEESFLKNSSFIDNLKLIGGWGLLGNQDVADLQYLTIMKKNIDYGNKYTFGSDKVGGAKISSLSNPNITWEKTGMTNIGIDGTFFNQKLTASVTWFDKRTVDMLVPTVSVGTLGRATIPDSNIGEIKNRGWEIEAGFHQQLSSGFTYDLNMNLSFVKNEVLKLYGNNNYISSTSYGRQAQEISRTYEGSPIASFYGWKTDGLYQTAQEIQNDPNIKNDPRKGNISPGDVRFIDINKDGIIDESDRTYIGDPNPNTILGVQARFGYKGFDFSMNIIGNFGADLYNADRMQGLDASYSYNMYTEAMERWHGEGTSNSIPKMSTQRTNLNHRTSDLFIESGNFVKMKTMTLGYTLPSHCTQYLNISSVRFYATAENLFTITSYSGYSPEIGYTDGNKQRGVDYAQYPASRKFTFGLKVNF